MRKRQRKKRDRRLECRSKQYFFVAEEKDETKNSEKGE